MKTYEEALNRIKETRMKLIEAELSIDCLYQDGYISAYKYLMFIDEILTVLDSLIDSEKEYASETKSH